MDLKPLHLDLKRDQGLRVQWNDGCESFYPVALLRKLSPSAEQQALREQIASNPLTVLPNAPTPTEALAFPPGNGKSSRYNRGSSAYGKRRGANLEAPCWLPGMESG